MAKFNVTGEQYFGITGQLLEIQRQIRLKSGSPLDPELVSVALQAIIEGDTDREKTKRKKRNRYLWRISDQPIVIEPCDGSAIIRDDLGAVRPLQTEDTPVQVYQMMKDATVAKIFGSLGADLDRLCLTQHQIKKFCQNHGDWLRTGDGNGTFFLLKIEDHYFAARVCMENPGLDIVLYKLDCKYVWDVRRRDRVVVPQLAT